MVTRGRKEGGVISLGLATLLGSLPPVAAVIQDWYVDASGPLCPFGDGTQANPFCRIMEAVAVAVDGDTIFLAPGTYLENIVLDQDLNLVGTGGESVTILDGGASGSVVNVRYAQVVALAGLTLTNGTGTAYYGSTYGGGLFAGYHYDHTITLTNCTISQNSADWGGGVYVLADTQAYPGSGLTLSGSTVSNNAGTRIGGISSFGELVLEDSKIVGNSAMGGSSAIGGVAAFSPPAQSPALTMTNCTVTGNTAFASSGDAIGGVYASDSSTSLDARITNTCLAENTAYAGSRATGGLRTSDLLMVNAIVSHNEASIAPAGSFAVDEIDMYRVCGCGLVGCCPAPTHFVSYSVVRGGWPGGNLDVDPLFVDPLNADFRLMPGSPCIDAGNNLSVPPGFWFDLDGKRRFIDDPSTPDTGQPGLLWPTVDMGPYEFGIDPPRKVRKKP